MAMPNRVYLDYNASTPLAPEVSARIQEFLGQHFGNPSATHWAAMPAKEAVEQARGQVADLLGCTTGEIIFTSGGTEASNHAIKGTFLPNSTGGHVITSAVEHPATLNPCRFLERLGVAVTVVPVDQFGSVDPEEIRRALRPETRLISLMHAQNEVGTLQPIRAVSRLARQHGVLFHCDAAQSVGKIPVAVNDLGVDLLSIAGHKVYAPKGVGALYVRQGVALEPFMHGAGHENGRRAGTENVLGIVGLGEACRLAKSLIRDDGVKGLRDRFWEMLQQQFGDKVHLNGHPTERLPNTLNVSFAGSVGSVTLSHMPAVAATTGAACHSGSLEISPVLKAMGIPIEQAAGAIRFSLGRNTTPEELTFTVEQLQSALRPGLLGAASRWLAGLMQGRGNLIAPET